LEDNIIVILESKIFTNFKRGENIAVVRLKNVIGKENSKGKLIPTIKNYDTTGISKAVNWQGGGEFIYCELN
jgi:hypothetical protein